MSNCIMIEIRDAIDSPSALTREQGEMVYKMIKEYIREGEKVILDFSNIESIITPFLNVAIGRLYKDFSSDTLKEKITICNIPEGKTSSFNLVIENAKRYYSNKDEFNQLVKEEVDV